MSNNGTKLVTLALVGACSFGVWKAGSALLSDEVQSSKHAVNRIWIDHVPTDERDMITNFIMVDHSKGKVGVTGRASQWRLMEDLFRWDLQGDTARLFFPQDRKRGEVALKTWECAGEAPAPFDLCMTMTNKQGRSWTLYSREDWEIDPGNVADSVADIVEDEPALSGLLGALDDDQLEHAGALELEQAQTWELRESF